MTPEFSPVGDRAVRVAFGDHISPRIGGLVQRFCRALESPPIPGVTEWVPAYAAVTVFYRPWEVGYDELCHVLAARARQHPDLFSAQMRRIEIPVCYGGLHGPDLLSVAALHGLSPAQAVRRHARPRYRVYFLGFLPGFAYLGGLPPSLATGRRETPRRRVPAGSVGIAGVQTGVYPVETPGGWQIIGRTPMRLYDPYRHPPALLAAGDAVSFVPITDHQFEEMAKDIAEKDANGAY